MAGVLGKRESERTFGRGKVLTFHPLVEEASCPNLFGVEYNFPLLAHTCGAGNFFYVQERKNGDINLAGMVREVHVWLERAIGCVWC